jgi:hypothetical protein
MEGTPGTVTYGKFSDSLALLGWSLNDTGKIVDNYDPIIIRSIAFNAPNVMSFFNINDVVLEKGETGYHFKNIDNESFQYRKELNNAPITNFIVEGSDVFEALQDDIKKDKIFIGSLDRYDILSKNSRKLQILLDHFKNAGIDVPDGFLNSANAIELALHDADNENVNLPLYYINGDGDGGAHELLQLAAWAQAIRNGKGSSDGFDYTCDPEYDPIPQGNDDLDNVIDGYDRISSSSLCDVFRKQGSNTIYMVFANNNALETASENRDKKTFTEYINSAYAEYRNILKFNNIAAINVVFIGHGGGGTLAGEIGRAHV